MSQTMERQFFDPFAENGHEFNALQSFELILERYQSDEIAHDYHADRFVADTEALLLDAVFVEQFEAVQMIAATMHQLCNHDQQLREQYELYTEQHHFDDHHEHHLHEHQSKDTDVKKKKKKKWGGWLKGWIEEDD